MKYFYLLAVYVLFIAGCLSSRNSGELSRDIDEITSAPSEVKQAGVTYILEPYIWRDLMPVTDSVVNKGIMALMKVRTKDSSAVKDSVNILRLWVINNYSIWEAKPVDCKPLTPDVIEAFFSRGPEWVPRTKVNVVVEFKINRKTKFLGLKNQEIQAAY